MNVKYMSVQLDLVYKNKVEKYQWNLGVKRILKWGIQYM